MKKRFSKLISGLIILTMVMTSTGLAFAAEGSVSEKQPAKAEKLVKNGSKNTGDKKDTGLAIEKTQLIEQAKGEFERTEASVSDNPKARTSATAFGAATEESVVELGNVEYNSLQNAIDNASNGDTIILNKDIINEEVVIDRGSNFSLTIDFNGNSLSTVGVDTLSILSGKITLKNGMVFNFNNSDDETQTGIYAYDSNVTCEDMIVTLGYDGGVGYYVDQYASVTLKDSAYLDSYYAGKDEQGTDAYGCFVLDGAKLTMNNCDILTAWDAGVVVEGNATINDSYVYVEEVGDAVSSFGGGSVSINGGYYYGDTGLWIDDSQSKATVRRGKFESMYTNVSAIDCYSDTSFGKNVTIPTGYTYSPSNWKTYGDDIIYIYKKYSAPKTVTAKLVGHDDILVSWSKVSGAKAYRIYYKKSTSSSYAYLGTRTTSTSITKTGLTDGAKYYFKVYACDKLDADGENYYGKGYYRSANSIYTLKKLNTPTVSKSSSNYVKVRWNNIYGESGYQISRSTSKTGTYIVSTYSTTSGTSKTIKATKGKTYYYKVRAYKTVDGKKVYAPWSSVRSYKLR